MAAAEDRQRRVGLKVRLPAGENPRIDRRAYASVRRLT